MTSYSEENGSTMRHLRIEGMTCDACARRVFEALESVAGVTNVHVPDWSGGEEEVTISEHVDPERLRRAVEEAGYSAHFDHSEGTAAAPNVRTNESGSDAYDLVIIGGGSAAFAAAIKASELGGRAVIINEGLPIGGTCVNVGRIPSKSFVRAGEAAFHARQVPFDGIRADGGVSDFGAVTRQTQALVHELRRTKYVDLAMDDPSITIVEGRARVASPHVVAVGDRKLHGRHILLATGARTFVPDMPGLQEVDYLTNENLYEMEDRPDHLIVLGGRYVALENAQAFARLGSKVTVLQRSPRILPTEVADLTDDLTAYLRSEGIDIRTGVTTRAVRRSGKEIVVETLIDGEEQTVRGSHVLLATGRRGNTEALGLDELGIETNRRGFVAVDEALRTSVHTIFAAGDVLGEQMFVYTAAYEGSLAAENGLQNAQTPRSYAALPWVVFTDPQVAGVGLDEAGAAEAGVDFEVAKLPLSEVPRSIAARDTRGFIKLIRDRETDRLVGARILAPEGSELLMEITLTIKHGITVRSLAETFHPYLTLSEGVKLAAIAFGKDVRKLSCCAG